MVVMCLLSLRCKYHDRWHFLRLLITVSSVPRTFPDTQIFVQCVRDLGYNSGTKVDMVPDFVELLVV